jgi:hypothetical protein
MEGLLSMMNVIGCERKRFTVDTQKNREIPQSWCPASGLVIQHWTSNHILTMISVNYQVRAEDSCGYMYKYVTK